MTQVSSFHQKVVCRRAHGAFWKAIIPEAPAEDDPAKPSGEKEEGRETETLLQVARPSRPRGVGPGEGESLNDKTGV
jgi:hypothetical protein